MSKCLFCENDVPQKDGKRARLFCNGNCRNKYYYKLATVGKPKKSGGRPKKEMSEEAKIAAAISMRSLSAVMRKVTQEKHPNSQAEETSVTVSLTPPMPTRNEGEDVFEFALRKSEWKKKYNQ